jgi:hypothetical protein
MMKLGKYDIEFTEDKTLRIYKEELGSFPIGSLKILAQRENEDELISLPVDNLTKVGEELNFTVISKDIGILLIGAIHYSSYLDGLIYDVTMQARVKTPRFNIKFQWEVDDVGVARWMVPGVFYKTNRPSGSQRLYPGFSPHGENIESYLSPYWAFASERTATPCVFAWTTSYSLYIGTRARFNSIESGVFFKGIEGKTTIGWCFPYREEPVRNCDYHPFGNEPRVFWLQLEEGESVDLWFQTAVDTRDLHYYHKILRFRYLEEKADYPLNPWVTLDESLQLLSYGLHQWHYDPARHIFAETAVFDRYYAKKDGYFDRDDMHVAWISGVPIAYALLWYGRNQYDDAFVDSAEFVIDNIANNLAPCGTFWAQYSETSGWTSSWCAEKGMLHARTLAEATLFMIRALRLELRRGKTHPNWVSAIKSNLEYCMKIQRDDGNFGTYYNAETGQVFDWDGTGGMLWTACLIAATMLFQDNSYVPAALKGANYYAQFIEDEFLYGAPEDIGCAPSSEDGYCALITYELLYQFNRFERWLELARSAADWMLTFRMSYNVEFPKSTILGAYDFRTRGADIASVVNAHLHNYGLICLPELMRMSYFYKDDYYKQRAHDNILCFRQFIARRDGDFGARKGMVSEQYYHTDWNQPKGHLLALSHAWCIAHSLLASLCQEQQYALP